MGQLTTVGIDLAKDVFAICVLDATGAVLQRRVLRREAFTRWAEQLSPCRVAMEACASSHHWGRWFAARGHTSRLIPAEFVKPFRLGGKNDAANAEAIAVAARQPTMRFVTIKSVEQQAVLAWHSVRAGWHEERTALLNRTRGLLAEFGVVIARSADRFLGALPTLIEDPRLPDPVRAMLLEVREQLAARQHSSGGRTRLGHISLRGNVYLRTLLVQGARSTLQSALRADPTHASRLQRWIRQLHERKGYHKTLIAIANKHARMLWAMLAKDERYDADAWQRHPLHPPLPPAAV
jgi:transposase